MTEEHFIWPYIMDRAIYHNMGRFFTQLSPNTLFPNFLNPLIALVSHQMLFRRAHDQGMARHKREDIIVRCHIYSIS